MRGAAVIGRDIWQNEANWPRDTAEYVFLARAIGAVGKALHDDEWTGEDPITEPSGRLPDRAELCSHYPTRRRVHEFLVRRDPKSRRHPPYSLPPIKLAFTPLEWDIARAHWDILA